MRLTRRAFAVGTALAISVTAGSSLASAEDFIVGGVGSLTGPAASFDIAVVDGVKAAIKYWNDQGGYKGRKIELRLFDDESQPPTAVTVYRRLTDDPAVKIVIAASPSSSLIAIKSVADEFKTPTTGSATLEALANPPAKYFFRTLPGADSYMRALMKWVKERGYKTLAALTPSDVTGQSEAAMIKKMADEMGIKLIAESYNNTDTNFTAQLVNIRNANPDFFYAGVIGGPSVLVFKQIKQLNLQMPLGIHSSAFNEAFYNGIGGRDKAEGIYTPIERGALGATASGTSAEFYKAATQNLGHPATNLNTAGFDTGLIVMQAVNNSDGSRDGIRNAIEALNDLPVIGGVASYSPTNHYGKDERSIAVGQIVEGKFVEAK
jgi:branched-chain amino acid transport system substrate-binding protein